MDMNQPWSVKGVEPEAREAAKLAARRSGMTLGVWLNRVIRSAAAEELSGGRPSPPSPASDPPQLPALPIDALLDAIKLQGDDIKRAVREAAAQIEKLDPALAKLDPALARLDPALARMEQAAEKIGAMGDLPQRLAEAEAKANKAALAVGPLERTVVRLSERLNPVDEPMHQPERRRGFLGRLFGG